VVVVDNGSSDGTADVLAEAAARWEAVRIERNEDNRGFAAACNQAARLADGELLCFLNNDTVVTPGWLAPLVDAVRRHQRVGMVGPVSNGVANEARVKAPYADLEELRQWAEARAAARAGRSFPIPMLALYCAVLRREVWDEVGELDEAFGVGMFEDDDYCRRLRRAGYTLRCREDSFVHHWQQASFDRLAAAAYRELYARNRARYRRKWGRG
jgi:GT2 family glycosyltransferase